MELAVHRTQAETTTGPPVVLLHGFTTSAATDFIDTGLTDALARAGRASLAIDLPGHGNSAALETARDGRIGAIATAILEAVAAEFPEGPFDVIGYSLGARIAWELPARSDRVRRLVLGGLSPFEPFAGIDFARLEAATLGEDPGDPMLGMMAGMIGGPGQRTASHLSLMRGLASTAFDPAAGVPSVPTLLLAGSADQMTEGIDALAAGLPSSELVRVQGDHRGALISREFRDASLRFLG